MPARTESSRAFASSPFLGYSPSFAEQGAGMSRKRKKGWLIMKISGLVLAALLVFIFLPRTVAKPIKKPIETTYGVEDVAFRESVGHLINAPLVPGNKVTTLING